MIHRNIVITSILAGTFIFVAILGIIGITNNYSAQAQSDQAAVVRQVTVIGTGEVTGTPDTAQVKIGVETEDKTAQEALAENNIRSTNVISSLLALEIDEKDIQTSNFSMHSTYDDKGRKVTGYRVTNVVSVKIRDLEKAGDLLDEVVQVGANSIYGISLSVDDPTDLFAQARENAMDDAWERANQLATGGQATLGDVMVITENVGANPVIMAREFGGADMAMAESAPSVPMQAGEQTFSTRVQVTFELR